MAENSAPRELLERLHSANAAWFEGFEAGRSVRSLRDEYRALAIGLAVGMTVGGGLVFGGLWRQSPPVGPAFTAESAGVPGVPGGAESAGGRP